MQARIDRKFLVPIVARDDKAAKLGRRGVVGMALKLGAKPENLGALERTIEQAHSSAWSTPSRTVTLLPSPRARGTSPSTAQENANGSQSAARKNLRAACCAIAPASSRFVARDGDEVIKLQGDPEAIEAGAEIRSGGGNAHRDLLLFQRKSPDNGGERTMAALILTRAVPTARQGGKADERLD